MQEREITGNLRSALKTELQINHSIQYASNQTWGRNIQDTYWKRLVHTAPNKKVIPILQYAKLMTSSRATNDRLHKMNIVPHPNCPLCQHHTDSNTHLLLHCPHQKIVNLRTKLHTDLNTLFYDHYICPIVTSTVLQFFPAQLEPDGLNYTSLQDMPGEWRKAWNKGQQNQERSWTEEIHGRAAELVLNLNHLQPIWLGTITCA